MKWIFGELICYRLNYIEPVLHGFSSKTCETVEGGKETGHVALRVHCNSLPCQAGQREAARLPGGTRLLPPKTIHNPVGSSSP